MTADHLVLVILDHAGGHLSGKTLLQKRAYFVVEILGLNIRFKAHFYGPFSPEIESALAQSKSLGFIQENAQSFGVTGDEGFELRRYDFSLTSQGGEILSFLKNQQPEECQRVEECLERLATAGDFSDYVSLSIAAKTYFIVKQRNASMTLEEIKSHAEYLGWKISAGEVSKAADFLRNAKLIAA
jgi:uncharacterized protein YwgA